MDDATSTSFSVIGMTRMWRRVRLVLLVYGVGLAVSVLVGSAVVRLLGVEMGPSGFSEHLMDRFDLVLWFDFWRGIGPGLAAVMRQVVIAGLLLMVWKVASQVGLIHALQGDGTSRFWDGVGKYLARGLGLGLLYLLPLLGLLMTVLLGAGSVTESWDEFGQFWTWTVAVPLLVLVLTAMFDLFSDYARIHLVLRESTVGRSWIAGIKWPFQHFRSVFLYKLWFLISTCLWVAVLAVGYYFPDRSVGAVVLAFFVQQLLIYVRTGASVSWIGAEIALFEQLAPPLPAPDSEAAAVGDTDSASMDHQPPD